MIVTQNVSWKESILGPLMPLYRVDGVAWAVSFLNKKAGMSNVMIQSIVAGLSASN